ncbi:hypothetical protein AAIE21_21470 [Paenibacillus sp. 102]|uniref:hypothetical protein n=1 Tax=Paenibacillus sp. 102 TaxID=3120823 RepID=UPI0031B9B694
MDGASDVEASFASQEEAKPSNILAAVAGQKSGSGSFKVCDRTDMLAAFATINKIIFPLLKED